jgi:hypothetical protein
MKFKYHLALQILLSLFTAACQSQGQQEGQKRNGSDWQNSRRQVPGEILASLPTKADTVMQTAHFLLLAYGETDTAALVELAGYSEAATEKLLRLTGYRGSLPPISHHLYPSSEVKGLLLRNTDHAHVDFEKNEVHTVLHEVYRDNFTGKENELLLRLVLGAPASPALEHGLAIYLTTRWQKKGWQHWASRLATSDNLPPLAGLFDPEAWERGSDLLNECLAAALSAFLMDKWGVPVFLKKYPSWSPAAGELAELENELHAFIGTLPPAEPRAAWHAGAPFTRMLAGFNFAHEGYAIYNGYGSRLATQALDKLDSLGSNAVAIVPYSFMREPSMPARIPVVKSPGSENDESVIHTAFQAQKKGMFVLMKPQIWLGRGNWTGDVAMQNEADWQAFFKAYHHWISHYALLAEIYRWDMLCIGTELVQTTLTQQADWRALIRRIRGLYGGKITYAANWGDEFENVAFWDDLDAIGLNCYYPLCEKDGASDQDLRRGFSKVVQKIEKVSGRFQKPVMFTEIGFPSSEAPWKSPHVDRNGAPFNGEHQRRCYEIVFEGIEGKPWCRGIFWWKFPTHPHHRGTENTGFTPYEKPAEAVVREWFARLK